MGLAEFKNDVKTLFLILNTLFELLPGLVSISCGIAFGVVTEMRYGATETVIGVVVGILTLVVAALGYCGAIKENKIMLYIYSGLMVLTAVGDLVGLLSSLVYRDITLTVIPILHLAGVLLNLVLAVTLATLSCRRVNQGCVLSLTPTIDTPNIK